MYLSTDAFFGMIPVVTLFVIGVKAMSCDTNDSGKSLGQHKIRQATQ